VTPLAGVESSGDNRDLLAGKPAVLVANARLRGWKLATADEGLLDCLEPSEPMAL
jgi:hypothetical protein